jgi:hypothetical protein
MEVAFKNKEIVFTKLSIDNLDPETELTLLTTYNQYLKEISKNNRPSPKEKDVVKEKEKEKESDINNKDYDYEYDHDDSSQYEPVKPVYSTVTNMEDIKRAFFNKEYDLFHELVRPHSFKYYKVNYKYASDNNGRPAFIAKNLLRGFIQNLEDYRKYLMVCFRCIQTNDVEYKYPSYWIVNSNDDIKIILGSLYDDFDFISVKDTDAISELLKKMEKNTDTTSIGEVYLHTVIGEVYLH